MFPNHLSAGHQRSQIMAHEGQLSINDWSYFAGIFMTGIIDHHELASNLNQISTIASYCEPVKSVPWLIHQGLDIGITINIDRHHWPLFSTTTISQAGIDEPFSAVNYQCKVVLYSPLVKGHYLLSINIWILHELTNGT